MTNHMAQLSAGRTYAKELWSRREFAWYMAIGNLRSRSASTTLGLVWWVINPLLMGAVYFVVFGLILNFVRDIAYLLSGIFVFYYASTSTTTGANVITQNTRLLVNLQFPRLVLPFAAVTEAGIGFLTSIPALFLVVGLTQGIWPTATFWWLFPVAFLLLSLFNLGSATLMARLTVPYRDVTNLVPHLLRIWFYLSPILYTMDKVADLPPWAQALYGLNPMVPFLAVFRAALLGYPLVPGDLAAAAAWSVVLATVSVAAFIRYEGKMARYL